MKFPNAARGISKIFTSEILSLIAMICTGIAMIFTVTAASAVSAGSETGTIAAGGGMLFFAFAASVLAIIAFILQIIGVIQSSRDEESFRMIIYLTIFSVVVLFIAGFIGSLIQNAIFSSVAQAFSEIIDFVCTLLVILGISNLAAQLREREIVEKCSNLFKVILCVQIIAFITRFVAIFMSGRPGLVVVCTILIIVGMVFSIVQYILYLSLLARAKRMLK